MTGFLIPFICCVVSLCGGCTLSTNTHVDEEYLWDVLEGGDGRCFPLSSLLLVEIKCSRYRL
jgi:hypothetical protein